MSFTEINARAKINIALDVLGKRTDGYHEIKTIMQTLELHDKIILKEMEKDEIKIISNSDKIPLDNSNLAYKAAEYMKKNYSIEKGIEINIEKNIPVSAGLAGGSADCAAVLKGLRNLYKLSVSDDELCEIGALMGSDVAYCVKGGTYLAEGRGEKITEIEPFPAMAVLVAKPDINVSTKWVYDNFDISAAEKNVDIDKMKMYIEENNIKGICDNLCNVLESVTVKKYPIIDEIKKLMVEFGALGSLMSGSGPSVFGLYVYKDDCLNTFKYLREKFKNIECYVTYTYNRPV